MALNAEQRMALNAKFAAYDQAVYSDCAWTGKPPHAKDERAPESNIRLWTQRKCLHCSGLHPGMPYSIPLFVHNADVGDVFVTDVEGRPMPCCRDAVYEALDHTLFWLNCTPSEAGCVIAHVYTCMPGGCGGPRLCHAAHVLAFADSFRGGRSGVLSRWEACTVSGMALGRGQIQVEPFCAVEDGGIGAPTHFLQDSDETLWIQPKGEGVVLRHKVAMTLKESSRCRVHLRAHFYDDGELGGCHWLGYRSLAGEAAVGLPAHASSEDFYQYMQGAGVLSAATAPGAAWQRTFVPRSAGWHFFELIWEEQTLHILIDNEPISKEPALGFVEQQEEVILYSSGSGYGVWAGVELFHTPLGQSSWGLGVQAVDTGELVPWQHVAPDDEKGFWQDCGACVIPHVSVARICRVVPTWEELVAAFETVSYYTTHPVMQLMLGDLYEVVMEQDGLFGLLCPDGFLRFFPPSVCIVPTEAESKPEALQEPLPLPMPTVVADPMPARPEVVPAAAAAATPVPREAQFTLECWSVPGETDIEQIERVLAHFSALLQVEGTVLPENIRLVAPCKEASHQRCFVYRFGTRRLHLAARSTDDGRLQLVVRCGGGFMDFLDFARRNGGLEQLRLQRRVGGNATGTIRLNRVLEGGRVSVHDEQRKRIPERRSGISRAAGA